MRDHHAVHVDLLEALMSDLTAIRSFCSCSFTYMIATRLDDLVGDLQRTNEVLLDRDEVRLLPKD